VHWRKKPQPWRFPTETAEQSQMKEDIRRAEQEWAVAHWQFHEAVDRDHVDIAIYSLEAAEKKLDMLLRKAKWQWNMPLLDRAGEGSGR